jgi:hypothetical protein
MNIPSFYEPITSTSFLLPYVYNFLTPNEWRSWFCSLFPTSILSQKLKHLLLLKWILVLLLILQF